MNIVLTGFMASGKSTVGKRLSELLSRPFFDTDAMVEEKMGMKTAEIFEKYGEPYFRALEKDAVCELSKMDGIIIATGGGVVTDGENVQNLRRGGTIINLKPEEEVIRERLKNDITRPLAASREWDDVLKLFEARKSHYDKCDFQIEIKAETSSGEICRKILDFIGEFI